MTVTRDADTPAEIGHLFQAFNRCCDGHTAEAVLSASVNMVVAAINFMERQGGGNREGAIRTAEEISLQLVPFVQAQWDRSAAASDVTVPLKGN